MAEENVTVARCGTCDRTGHLTLVNGRIWCGLCEDWAKVALEVVATVQVVEPSASAVLQRTPGEWYPLQPLRIPQGWTVAYNGSLYEIDPPATFIPKEDRWIVFKEDMLQMHHDGANRVLDVGWHPEGETATGFYKLVVYEGDFHGRLLYESRGNNRLQLVAEIERLLMQVFEGKL